MALGAVIVARMDSRRLPGKVLLPLLDRPVLGHVVARCRQVAALEGRVVLATSDRPVDDRLEEYARAEGLEVCRGSAENVAERVLQAAQGNGFDAFYRVNADSPCLEPGLLASAADHLEAGGYDLVTNLCPRSFPYGVSVELLRTDSYARAFARMNRREQREHVTLYCYEHLEEFRYFNLENPCPRRPLPRLTIDEQGDLERVACWMREHPAGAFRPVPVPTLPGVA